LDKKEFRYRLRSISKELLEFAQPFVKNELNTSIILYRIEADDPTFSNHLNDYETLKLQEINSLKNQICTEDKAVDILCFNEKTPLWINVEIFKSSKKDTIINLSCSRRFVLEEKLNKKVTLFPPFKKGIQLPPWYVKEREFNINWKHQTWKRKWYQLMWRFYVKKYQKNSLIKNKTHEL